MTWPVVTPAVTVSGATIAYGTYPWFLLSVGLYKGLGANPDAWDDEQTNLVDYFVQRGANQFYFPPSLPPGPDGKPYTWSFLKLVQQISLVDATSSYDLTDPNIQAITFEAGDTSQRIEMISYDSFRAVVSKVSANGGLPKYAAVAPKALATTAEQVYELHLYPTPSTATMPSSGKVDVYYHASPAVMTMTNLHPQGGLKHAETILASMLAIAELDKDGQPGPMDARFKERLQGSLAYDMVVAKAQFDSVKKIPDRQAQA